MAIFLEDSALSEEAIPLRSVEMEEEFSPILPVAAWMEQTPSPTAEPLLISDATKPPFPKTKTAIHTTTESTTSKGDSKTDRLLPTGFSAFSTPTSCATEISVSEEEAKAEPLTPLAIAPSKTVESAPQSSRRGWKKVGTALNLKKEEGASLVLEMINKLGSVIQGTAFAKPTSSPYVEEIDAVETTVKTCSQFGKTVPGIDICKQHYKLCRKDVSHWTRLQCM